jgi:polyphosphate kinase
MESSDHAQTVHAQAAHAGPRLINREASWLNFNERVLSLASDPTVPLLERVKFLAIFSGNLDEFYEVRVAGLKEQAAAGVTNSSSQDPILQLATISDAVQLLTSRQSHVLHEELMPQLRAAGIEIVSWESLDDQTRAAMTTAFEAGIFPVLTPLAVDPGHPFPYISNKSLNLAVVIRDAAGNRFARVKVPPLLPRFIPIGQQKLLPLESLVAAHVSHLFPGLEIESTHSFRVTRNADLSMTDSDADDLLAAVETELRRRRFGRAVRLEVSAGTPKEVVDLLLAELEMGPDDATEVHGLLDLTSLWAVHGLNRPDLKDEQWTPITRPAFAPNENGIVDIFAAIRNTDILVHHPYDSFASSVEAFIRQAARDQSVLTIKATLYRTSGNSPIARALIEAAELGKQVAVLIELKARFDEQANIAWAKAMEQVGIHVAYGVVGLKTHAKVALVVRAEEHGLRRYCHIGTGNYNSSTARLYEDVGLFTCDPAIGADLTKLFNTLTGFGRPERFEKLVVAPAGMRDRIIELIRAEGPTATRGPGRIALKLNSLVDTQIIDALYDVSQLGVQVDLVIRGICCLRPGVPGLSDGIRVRSVIGRYLEHSRIFHFANGAGDGEPVWLFGSADMMPRNLDGRVETLVPVTQVDLVAELDEIMGTLLRDDVRGWELSDSSWKRLGEENTDAQYLRYKAVAASRKRHGGLGSS